MSCGVSRLDDGERVATSMEHRGWRYVLNRTLLDILRDCVFEGLDDSYFAWGADGNVRVDMVCRCFKRIMRDYTHPFWSAWCKSGEPLDRESIGRVLLTYKWEVSGLDSPNSMDSLISDLLRTVDMELLKEYLGEASNVTACSES